MLSYRKLAMCVLGRPLHTEGIDSPRPASQRAAAFILTAAMLTTLAAPAFAGTWYIEDGDITISGCPHCERQHPPHQNRNALNRSRLRQHR